MRTEIENAVETDAKPGESPENAALLAELKNYLRSYTASVENIGLKLRLEKGVELTVFPGIYKGADWIINAVKRVAPADGPHSFVIDETGVNACLAGLLEAVRARDEILMADILEYELLQRMLGIMDFVGAIDQRQSR